MVDSLQLNDGTSIPALGFGLYKVDPADTASTVAAGIDAGYTLVDGAAFYHNEPELGRALAAQRRDGLLVTSKFWGDPEMGHDAAIASFEQSERDLGTTIDIFMIHWPRPVRDQYVDTWRALVELQRQGRVRTIGVANFEIEHLQRLVDETGVAPAINQIESHPWLPQRALRAYASEHGIVTQAWSPLGRGRILDDQTIASIAASHDATPAQVVLAWHLRLGGAAIPKSTRAERLRENLAAAEIALSDADMTAIAALESGQRTGTSPAERN